MLKRPRIDPLPPPKKKERKEGGRERKRVEKKVYCLKTRHAWVLHRGEP